jgi:hypothetical protein
VATRYEKTAGAFKSVLCLAATMDWLKSDFDSYLPKMGLKAALCRGKTWNCALS